MSEPGKTWGMKDSEIANAVYDARLITIDPARQPPAIRSPPPAGWEDPHS